MHPSCGLLLHTQDASRKPRSAQRETASLSSVRFPVGRADAANATIPETTQPAAGLFKLWWPWHN